MAPGETSIYLIRHAESEANKENVFQGSGLSTNLTPLGRSQAALLGRHVKGLDIEKLYSSPLHRAFQTASIAFGTESVKVVDDMRERSFGKLEGMGIDAVRKKYPELMKSYENSGSLPGVGAESKKALQERAWKALDMIIRGNTGSTIAVVAHGALIQSLLARVLGMPLANMRKIRQFNCGVNKLTFGGDARVEYLNDTSFLRYTMQGETI